MRMRRPQRIQIGGHSHQRNTRGDGLIRIVVIAEQNGGFGQLDWMMEAIASEERLLSAGNQVQHLVT
jgi:hypothetical protein